MNLTIISDLHVDINGQEPLPHMEGDILVVAGDVSNSAKKTSRTVNELAKNFSRVVFIDGNHEHYNNLGHNPPIKVSDNVVKIYSDFDVTKINNIHFLEDEKIAFLGINGWYSGDFDREAQHNLEYWAKYMNDYRCTFKGTNQPYPFELAIVHVNLLDQLIEASLRGGYRPIVVTHTVPHEDLLWRKPWDPYWERAHAFFLNKNSQKLVEKYGDQILAWIFGHTHCTLDKNINGIRFLCNPRGYPGENPGWAPLKINLEDL